MPAYDIRINLRTKYMQYTYQLVTTKQLEVSYTSILNISVHSASSYAFVEDLTMRRAIRSVSQKIFECNVPDLRIFVMQELQELSLYLSRCQDRLQKTC